MRELLQPVGQAADRLAEQRGVGGTDVEVIRAEIAEMASSAATWLVRRELYARTVTIKVRYNDFTTITRSHTAPPSRDADRITARAVALLDRTEVDTRPVRLLGVSVHNLTPDPFVMADDPEPWLPFDED